MQCPRDSSVDKARQKTPLSIQSEAACYVYQLTCTCQKLAGTCEVALIVVISERFRIVSFSWDLEFRSMIIALACVFQMGGFSPCLLPGNGVHPVRSANEPQSMTSESPLSIP